MYLIQMGDGSILNGPDDQPLRFKTLRDAHNEIETADACGVDTVYLGITVIREPIDAWIQSYE